MSRNDYIISKALRNADVIADAILEDEVVYFMDEDVEKGMPSAIRQATRLGQQAGKDSWSSTSGANALMFRQKMGQAGASVPKRGQWGSNAVGNAQREGQWAKEKYKEQLAYVARQRGNTGGLLKPSDKAVAARSRRMELMRQNRPVQIQGGAANRPAW